jgi:hypothetical protein
VADECVWVTLLPVLYSRRPMVNEERERYVQGDLRAFIKAHNCNDVCVRVQSLRVSTPASIPTFASVRSK